MLASQSESFTTEMVWLPGLLSAVIGWCPRTREYLAAFCSGEQQPVAAHCPADPACLFKLPLLSINPEKLAAQQAHQFSARSDMPREKALYCKLQIADYL